MSGSRYESFRIATLGLVVTWMRVQVIEEGAESVDGRSPVESRSTSTVSRQGARR